MTSHFRGILALLIVTIAWGTTFPAMKDLTTDFSPVWIIFIRFALGALLLLPFLFGASRRDVAIGALLGVLLFACYLFQVEGLALTTSNRNAFITGLNVLVVPLLGMAGGKLPHRRIVVALLLAVTGLFALCGGISGEWGRGDTLALMGAFAFGLYIKMLELTTRRADKLMALTAAQVCGVAVCAALLLWFELAFELAVDAPRADAADVASGAGAHALAAIAYWDHIAASLYLHALNFAYLGIVCTAAIIALQTWGQRHSTANEAAVIYAFEPACAAFFAYFWLAEAMTPWGWVGAALLISGMIISQWSPVSARKLASTSASTSASASLAPK